MAKHLFFLLLMLMLGGPACASGWHDYALEIAPGFTVFRMNSFEICLGRSDRSLLICPEDYPGQIGPLVEYAVTADAIVTRHLGVRPDEQNPSMPQADPDQEFFFLVRRSDQEIVGPLNRLAWEQRGLPPLASLAWVAPRNPSFWTPLLGNLFFVGYAAAYWAWPLMLLGLMGVIIVWRLRRRPARPAGPV